MFHIRIGKQNGTGKRGRPRKHPVSSDESENEEESDEKEQEETIVDSDQESDDIEEQTNRRRKNARKYDSDQSYKESPPSKRKSQREHFEGAGNHSTRPTRSATKRESMRWSHADESNEEAHDDELHLPSSSQNVSSTRRVDVIELIS